MIELMKKFLGEVTVKRSYLVKNLALLILLLPNLLISQGLNKKYFTKNVWKCTNIDPLDSAVLEKDTLIVEFAGIRTKDRIESNELFLCDCLDFSFYAKKKEFGYYYIDIWHYKNDSTETNKVIKNYRLDLYWQIEKKSNTLKIYDETGFSKKYYVILDEHGLRMVWVRLE